MKIKHVAIASGVIASLVTFTLIRHAVDVAKCNGGNYDSCSGVVQAENHSRITSEAGLKQLALAQTAYEQRMANYEQGKNAEAQSTAESRVSRQITGMSLRNGFGGLYGVISDAQCSATSYEGDASEASSYTNFTCSTNILGRGSQQVTVESRNGYVQAQAA